MSTAAKVASIGGLSLLIGYLLRIQFTPTGVALGDSWMFFLIFVSALLLLGIANLLILSTGYIAYRSQQYLFSLRWKGRRAHLIEGMQRNPYIWLVFCVLLWVIVILGTISYFFHWLVAPGALLFCYITFMLGSVRLVFAGEEKDLEHPSVPIIREDVNLLFKRGIARLILTQMPLFFVALQPWAGGPFFNAVMRLVGIRQERVEVKLPKDVSDLMKSRIPSDLQPRLMTVVLGTNHSEEVVFWKVDLVFHGIGSSTCMEIHYGTKSFTLSVPNKDLVIIRNRA